MCIILYPLERIYENIHTIRINNTIMKIVSMILQAKAGNYNGRVELKLHVASPLFC